MDLYILVNHVVCYTTNVSGLRRYGLRAHSTFLTVPGGDGNIPQCARCTRTGRNCVRGQRKTRFRQARGRGPRTRFPGNQVWVKPPPRVDFVLESGNGELDDTVDLSVERHHLGDGLVFGDNPPTPSPDTPTFPSTIHNLGALINRDIAEESQSPEYLLIREGQGASPRQRSWPLRDPEEAFLLKHFVDRTSSFFDCTDHQRHFAVHIPYRARYCDTLFNAIMALSARQLSCTTSYDAFVSAQYYQACLETLIPALNDQEVTMDDDLLAATVILRLLEEFDVPLAGSDMRGHSFGTRAFIQGPPPSMTTTPSLRQAVYWSGLRQEIYNALSLQQAPDVDLSSLHSLFTALGPDDGDCLWANQAIAHCADVLLFSFGTQARSTSVHADLQEQNQHWSDSRPPSFDPYFLANEEGEIGATFPDIRFSSPWHAIGYQYHELARILLFVNDPGLPTVGPLRRRLAKEADSQIRKSVWTMCGVALSNSAVPPAMVVGCMALHLCGDRFTDLVEQEKLIQVLLRTERLHGWPTHALQGQLRETWGVHESETV
ncbi:uncharacterized protein N7496_009427 [Penicillium cataractarum]|uniref:Zn(2)-C6 fungal-type domain-containing protein n=1 Tax=Penicillium cataractarum TaxID=2100454 RepID=A0A9W9V0Z2_9EURO|nr:uncharacterized protein N7496_009427 [Penicillium cataractarum]KAJ5363714.1 hypothetical protein N7496_009427 [Penicillium cataractarum]